MIGSFSHHKLGNLKIKSALVFAIPSILSLLLVRKIIPLLPDTLFSVNSFDVTKNLLIMIVCLSNDCNRFHDSQIKENQRRN
jgi:uncharacterized membrane protein YfcA